MKSVTDWTSDSSWMKRNVWQYEWILIHSVFRWVIHCLFGHFYGMRLRYRIVQNKWRLLEIRVSTKKKRDKQRRRWNVFVCAWKSVWTFLFYRLLHWLADIKNAIKHRKYASIMIHCFRYPITIHVDISPIFWLDFLYYIFYMTII